MSNVLTGMQIPLFAMKTAIKGLEIEVNTGMKMARHSMKEQFINNLERLTGERVTLPRSKVKALEHMNTYMDDIEDQIEEQSA